MAKASNDMFIIWPEYFNANLTKAKGRRMPISLSVNSPDIEDVYSIARKLGLSPVIEKEKSHPSRWMDTNGRIKVSKKYTKTQTMKMIGERLKQMKK